MRKIFFILGFFIALSTLCWAGGNQEKNKKEPTQLATQTPESAHPVSLYWEGDGGKGIRLGIRVPESQGLNANQTYLPTLIQGVLVSNMSKYSAIDVLDRISLDKILAETLDPVFEDNIDVVRLGHVAQVENWLTGNIIRTSSGYTLQINITDTTPNANTVASFSGNFTVVALDNHDAMHQASLSLLEQMGVRLTQKAKDELRQVSTLQNINAHTALSQGIMAQQRGTVVEALTYYYTATAFDSSVLEAANRATVMATAIISGNIGENVRNDIQRRNAWLKILQEAAVFFKAHPPYEIVYDPDLIEGTIDYKRETVDIYCKAGLHTQASGFKVIKEITQGLKNTGRSDDWGLASWPESGEAAIFTSEIQNYKLNLIIKNDNGITIGRAAGEFKGGNLSFSYDYGTLIFHNVDANAISSNLSVAITTVNGIDTKIVRERNLINIISGNITFADIYDFVNKNGTIEITGYKGTHSDIVIPSTVNGVPVRMIGNYAFDRYNKVNKITNVVIPNGITSIGNGAFRQNLLTTLIIPNGVTFIGYDAFIYNELKNISMPANVKLGSNRDLRNGAFGHSSVTDPFDEYFDNFYEKNGKKAGIYTYTNNITYHENLPIGRGVWNYSP